MKTKKEYLSIFILLFINFLFIFKYMQRIAGNGLFFSVLISLVLVFIYRYLLNDKQSEKASSLWGVIFVIYLITVAILSHVLVKPETLNVDRYSVITSFFDKLYKGEYPYLAKSHLGNNPGPMPFYFFIAFPFYLLGELNILSLVGYAITIFLIIRKGYLQKFNYLIFILYTSIFMLWEIIARSNIYSFSVFTVLAIVLFIKSAIKGSSKLYLISILLGLLLSTRSIFILVYIICVFSLLINKVITLKNFFFVGLIILAVFVSTFLPFVFYFFNDFIKINPFVIQSSFLIPPVYGVLFILIAAFFLFFTKDERDILLYSGLSLFVSILIYSLCHIFTDGFKDAFFNSKIDISYFIFSTPFFVFYLSYPIFNYLDIRSQYSKK